MLLWPAQPGHNVKLLAHQKIVDRTTHIELAGCAESADLGIMSR
jgi:hypothetical protein